MLSGFLERLSVLPPPSGDMAALVSFTDTADSVTLSMSPITYLCPGNQRTEPTVEVMPPGPEHVTFFGVVILCCISNGVLIPLEPIGSTIRSRYCVLLQGAEAEQVDMPAT